jgi:hypothetical protein
MMKNYRNVLATCLAMVPVSLNASVYVAPDHVVSNPTVEYNTTCNFGCNAADPLDPAFYPSNIEVTADISLIQSRLVYEDDQDGDLVIRTNQNGGHEARGSLLPVGVDDQGNIIVRRKIAGQLFDDRYLLVHHPLGYYVTKLNGDNEPVVNNNIYLAQRMYSYPTLNMQVFTHGDGRKDLAHVMCHLSEGAIRPDEHSSRTIQTTIYKPLVPGDRIHLKICKDVNGSPALVQTGEFIGPRKHTDMRLLNTAKRLALDIRAMLDAAVNKGA